MRLSEVLVLNKFSSRYLVCYKDLNAHRTLHGGVLVRWMDEVSGMHARAITGGTCVTRLIDKISFVSKANAGDIMFIETTLKKAGKTSLTFEVSVWEEVSKRLVAELSNIIFVAVDGDGIPRKHNVTLIGE